MTTSKAETLEMLDQLDAALDRIEAYRARRREYQERAWQLAWSNGEIEEKVKQAILDDLWFHRDPHGTFVSIKIEQLTVESIEWEDDGLSEDIQKARETITQERVQAQQMIADDRDTVRQDGRLIRYRRDFDRGRHTDGMGEWVVYQGETGQSSDEAGRIYAGDVTVNIRAESNTKSSIIATLLAGQGIGYSAIVIDELVVNEDRWYQVQLPDGRTGYISAVAVTVDPTLSIRQLLETEPERHEFELDIYGTVEELENNFGLDLKIHGSPNLDIYDMNWDDVYTIHKAAKTYQDWLNDIAREEYGDLSILDEDPGLIFRALFGNVGTIYVVNGIVHENICNGPEATGTKKFGGFRCGNGDIYLSSAPEYGLEGGGIDVSDDTGWSFKGTYSGLTLVMHELGHHIGFQKIAATNITSLWKSELGSSDLDLSAGFPPRKGARSADTNDEYAADAFTFSATGRLTNDEANDAARDALLEWIIEHLGDVLGI